MAFVEDFTVFFADFGVVATPNAGAAITVIFDRDSIQALGGEISATGPIALAQSADVVEWAPHETFVTIDDVDYILRDTKPDGTGLTLLLLEVAA